VWWLAHRPIWGLNPYAPVSAMEANLEQSLTTAIKTAGPAPDSCWQNPGLPCSLKTVIAGHVHNLERVQFFGSGADAGVWQRPMQYISGNGGVVLNPAMSGSPCAFTVPQSSPDTLGPNLPATVDWVNAHGYTLWTRGPAFPDPSGWREVRYLFEGGSFFAVDPPKLDGTSASQTC
jgi:hypothetical protein